MRLLVIMHDTQESGRINAVIHDTIYYIAQRKKKVHTITGSNQTVTADIWIFSVLLSRRYPEAEEQLDFAMVL